MSAPIFITECPRDAMQGWPTLIPTERKIEYLNTLLQVGFDVLDCGSFVSAKAIPQLADTKDVLPQLKLDDTQTKLLVIVANERGAQEAVAFEQVSFLGYPFSISETFQKLNTNATIEESLSRVEAIHNLCVRHNKSLMVYISMGFGNPYGDTYNPEIVIKWFTKLQQMGITHFALADTVGVAQPAVITEIFGALIPQFKDVHIGAHFHTTSDTWQQKIDAASQAGCTAYDGAIAGIGGCPMAQNELVGNMDTVNLLSYFKQYKHNSDVFAKAVAQSSTVFVH